MKQALVLLLAVILAVPAFAADERQVKRDLIAELLDVIDTKTLTRASFDVLFNRVGEEMGNAAELQMAEEEKQAYQEHVKKQQEEMNAFRERLFNRIDYVKYAEEVYAPLFDETFTADELRELIAFYKTKAGQKTARMLPELAVGGMVKGMQLLQEEAQKIGEELQQEERKKNPHHATMADMRSIATAVEAYATDVEAYPKVSSIEELKKLIEPIYIRTVPLTDGWGTAFTFVSDGKSYRLASAGADKRFEWSAKQIEKLPENSEWEPRWMESEDADIIYQDGNFVQAPAKARPRQ